MGREWNWTRSFKRGNTGDKQRNHPANSAGCMGSMLHVFDLHRILFFAGAGGSSTPAGGYGYDDPPFQEGRPPPSNGKGLEAPRNSLELEAAPSTTSSFHLEIPSSIQVVPGRWREVVEEARSSEGSHSARTGNLVARLMGLDHLPDHRASFSPRSSTSYFNQQRRGATNQLVSSPATHHDNGKKGYSRKLGGTSSSKSTTGNGRHSGSQTPPPRHPLQPRDGNIVAEVRHGTRSLPETPRASLARRSWDSDPRLSPSTSSLRHSNSNSSSKENMLTPSAILELKSICTDQSALLYSPPPLSEASRSAKSKGKEYAREIVRQVKNSVSRRIAGNGGGRDGGGRGGIIINTDTGSDDGPIRSMRKARSSLERVQQQPNREESPSPPTLSTTPRVEPRRSSRSNSPDREPPRKQEADSTRPIPAPTATAFASKQTLSAPSKALHQHVFDKECRKACLDRFMERLKKPPPAAAPPRRNALISPPRAKVAGSSPTPPAAANNGLGLCCGDRSNGKDTTDERRAKQPSGPAWSRSPPAGAVREDEAEDRHYVESVLRKSGFYASNPCAVRWHSPSHPLDPVLFHQLELLVCCSSTTSHYYRGALRRRCNRKLLYDLVDEVLAEALWPFLGLRRPSDGSALLRRLLTQIGAYPSADCKVMEDVDALVEMDLPDANVRRLLRHPAVAEEADAVAAEVEGTLLDSLLEDSIRQL